MTFEPATILLLLLLRRFTAACVHTGTLLPSSGSTRLHYYCTTTATATYATPPANDSLVQGERHHPATANAAGGKKLPGTGVEMTG